MAYDTYYSFERADYEDIAQLADLMKQRFLREIQEMHLTDDSIITMHPIELTRSFGMEISFHLDFEPGFMTYSYFFEILHTLKEYAFLFNTGEQAVREVIFKITDVRGAAVGRGRMDIRETLTATRAVVSSSVRNAAGTTTSVARAGVGTS